jgi:tetratricopeptide (TPR) repeat protein
MVAGSTAVPKVMTSSVDLFQRGRLPVAARPASIMSVPELFQRGLAAHQCGQLRAAAEIYRQVLRLAPGHADSSHLLGVVAHQSGQGAVAVEHITRAIGLDPEQAHYHYNLGLALLVVGRVDDAVATFDAALRLRPDYPEVHYNRGNALKQQGRIQEAVECYRRALRHRPNYVEAYNNLGNCLLQLGRPGRAETAFRRALRITPDAAEVHHNLGLALRDLGRNELAIESFREALRLRADFADPCGGLAAALRAVGQVRAAIVPLRHLVMLRPDDAEVLEALAAALNEVGEWDEAERQYRAVLRISPERWSAMQGLAEALRMAGRMDEAEMLCRRLLEEHSGSAESYNNLANVLHQLGRHDEAIILYRRALELKRDFVNAHVNLGNVLRDTRAMAAAEESYNTALALDPENADAHVGLGALRLRNGRLAEGWPELEWRFRGTWRFISFSERDLGRPRWTGEALGGRTLLLHAEQGFGDTIQFCRYIAGIARDGRVVLEVPKALVGVMSGLDGIDAIVTYGDALPAFDLHCPLLSLPLVVGTTLATIPAAVPYLHAEVGAVAAWRRRLEPLGGLRVGLVWGGNPRYPNDRWRSASLEHLAPLASVAGVTFVSLQKGPPAAQAGAPPAGMMLHDWTDELEDFSDTAALVSALDLVISTDTSVPHLAGALGKPVWLLSSYDACWRWLLNRDDSPWYPTLRQFRQRRLGDWGAPVEDVRAALLRETER